MYWVNGFEMSDGKLNRFRHMGAIDEVTAKAAAKQLFKHAKYVTILTPMDNPPKTPEADQFITRGYRCLEDLG